MRALPVVLVAVVFGLACGPPPDPFDGALVLVEPSTTIEDHIAAGVERWGDDFAIAVISASETAECEADPNDHTTYCNARVSATRLLRTGGLPDGSFWLHYWYPSDAHFPLDPGVELLAFLAPTHQPDAFAPSALLEPTRSNVSAASR